MCISAHCPNYQSTTTLGSAHIGGISPGNFGTTAWPDQAAALIAAIHRLAEAIEKMEAAKAAPSGD